MIVCKFVYLLLLLLCFLILFSCFSVCLFVFAVICLFLSFVWDISLNIYVFETVWFGGLYDTNGLMENLNYNGLKQLG